MKEVYEHPDDLTPKFRKECKKTVSQICCKRDHSANSKMVLKISIGL